MLLVCCARLSHICQRLLALTKPQFCLHPPHKQAKITNKLSSNKEAAFHELIAYLDSLAARKASGDKTAQDDIATVSALLRSK